jgi:hypothetical protein
VLRVRAQVDKLVIVAGVAFAWVLLFHLNQYAFSHLEYSSRANWIFLPAALRITFVLLFNRLGAIGLMVGAYFTLPESLESFQLQNVVFAASSGIAPLVAVYITKRFISLADDLSGLKGGHILVLSGACAFANSLILNAYLALMPDRSLDMTQIATIFVGDMLGAAIVLMVTSSSLVLVLRFLRSSMYR